MSWGLPTTVTLAGVEHGINTDYRDILEIMEHMNSEDAQQGAMNALYCFYERAADIPAELWQDAWTALCDFVRCGQAEDENAPARKLIDWEQDAGMIAAEVNKVAGCEVRAIPYMHWFTFMGHFSAVGEGQLSTLVGIRAKRAKGKKLEKWEQEYYRENKNRVDFAKKYNHTEEEEKAAILRLLGD